MQADIIPRQQQFLESLDRKEREVNIVALGLPDEGEALDGAVTDTDKLKKVWEKVGVACRQRRLGAQAEGGRRSMPLLLTIPEKNIRWQILATAIKT